MSDFYVGNPKESALVRTCDDIVRGKASDTRRALQKLIKTVETTNPPAPECMEAAYTLAGAFVPRRTKDFFFAGDILINAISSLLKKGMGNARFKGPRWDKLLDELIRIETGRGLGRDNEITTKPVGELLDFLTEKGYIEPAEKSDQAPDPAPQPAPATSAAPRPPAGQGKKTPLPSKPDNVKTPDIQSPVELQRYSREVKEMCDRGQFVTEGPKIAAYLQGIRRYVSRNRKDIGIQSLAGLLSVLLSSNLSDRRAENVARDVLNTVYTLLDQAQTSPQDYPLLAKDIVQHHQTQDVQLRRAMSQDFIKRHPELAVLTAAILETWQDIRTLITTNPDLRLSVNLTFERVPGKEGPRTTLVSSVYSMRDVDDQSPAPRRPRRGPKSPQKGPKPKA